MGFAFGIITHMNKTLILLVILGAIACLAVYFQKKHNRPKKSLRYQYKRKGRFFTPTELSCFDQLNGILGKDFYIFPQVHLSSLLDHRIVGQNFKAAFNHINGKSVDFVLCDKEHAFLPIAVELDDPSHEKIDRVERDAEVERMLDVAGLPLLRLECQKPVSEEWINVRINELRRRA